jgi:hypothetical protein
MKGGDHAVRDFTAHTIPDTIHAVSGMDRPDYIDLSSP